ncbi:MAG TPA: zincin-like metallopeptidase domain-containing protein [Rhizomicrobium sp.]|nr:zincin-like metallopeptidase domain-containing protein [Rhizomicrobium sp.]
MRERVPSTLYQSITEEIVEAIKQGAGTFQMPWHTSPPMPVNAATDAPYRGINVVSLWIGALKRGYASGYWASYRQWQKLGSQVRKGERGTLIVFYKGLPQPEGEPETEGRRFVLKSSHVFNAAQVEGWTPPDLPAEPGFDPHAQAEAFVSATGARVRHGFHHARYRADLDDIEMPSRAWFTGSSTSTSLETYYATLLHELTHWSGASHRLAREFGKRFGDQAYAMEELVAELGAAFLCAHLGITNRPRPDHAAYLASWLQILEADTRAVFLAASQAQQAVEYLGALAADNRS